MVSCLTPKAISKKLKAFQMNLVLDGSGYTDDIEEFENHA